MKPKELAQWLRDGDPRGAQAIGEALVRADGKVEHAAKQLGVWPRTVWAWARRHRSVAQVLKKHGGPPGRRRREPPRKGKRPVLLARLPVYRHVATALEAQRQALGVSQGEVDRRTARARVGLAAGAFWQVQHGYRVVALHQLPVYAKALECRVKDLLPPGFTG